MKTLIQSLKEIEIWYLDMANIVSHSWESAPAALNNATRSVAIGWASCIPIVLHATRRFVKGVTLDPFTLPKAGSETRRIPHFTVCKGLDNFVGRVESNLVLVGETHNIPKVIKIIWVVEAQKTGTIFSTQGQTFILLGFQFDFREFFLLYSHSLLSDSFLKVDFWTIY